MSTKPHWLQSTLLRAGIGAADSLGLTADTPDRRAWAAAGARLGLTEAQLAEHVASRFHLRLADFGTMTPAVSKLVPESVVRRHHLLPLREDDRDIVVAVSNPTDLDAEQAVAFATGRQVVFEVAPPTTLAGEIERRYAPGIAVEQLMERVDARAAESVRVVDEIAGTIDRARGGESGAVVKLTNLMLRAAIDRRATAVEIGTTAGSAAITFLIDGMWTRFMPLPVPAMNHVIGRLRLLGNMGVASRARPGAGGARIRVEGRTWDLALDVESGPPPHARIRIYDQQSPPRLEDLGLSAESLDALRAQFAGGGLILITAPEDQGGEALLHAVLREVAQASRRIALAGAALWPLQGIEFLDPGADGAHAASFDVIGFDDAAARTLMPALADHFAPRSLVIAQLAAENTAQALRALQSTVESERLPQPRTIISLRALRRVCDGCRGAATEPPCDHCGGTGFRGTLSAVDVATGTGPFGEDQELLGLRHDADRHVRTGATTQDEIQRALREPEVEAEPAIRILVADDDPLIRMLARTVLEADGYAVDEAEDGLDALARIGDTIGLLVVDLDMPRLDGHELVARLKRNVATAGLPIIVLTASASSADETRALEQGADDYIRKPIDPPRFLARIRAVLRRVHG